MARVKKTEQEKDLLVINTIKIVGMFVHIIGYYIIIMMTAATAMSALAIATNGNVELATAINDVSRDIFVYTTVTMSIVLIYEAVNYVLYLFKSKIILVMSIIVEIITLVVLCVLRKYDVESMQTYPLLLPIISGVINYFIIKLQEN
jgi:hypothetical protein